MHMHMLLVECGQCSRLSSRSSHHDPRRACARFFCECCLLPFFVMRWDVAGFLRGENDVTYCTSSNFQHATIN